MGDSGNRYFTSFYHMLPGKSKQCFGVIAEHPPKAEDEEKVSASGFQILVHK